jgi:hypothetical protein
MDSEFTPFKNLTGSAIAASLSILLYWLTISIGKKLAANPITTSNSLAIRISVIVRQVVITIGTTGSMIFGLIAIGLLLFTIQQITIKLWQKMRSSNASLSDTNVSEGNLSED